MAIPLFKIFRTINSDYLYDSNKNQIFPVSKEAASLLKKVESGKLSMEVAQSQSNEISSLRARGILSERRVEVIEHPYTELSEVLLTRRLQKVTLQLTQNCNFRCAYCHYTSNDGQQRTHSNRTMPIEMAKQAILFLRDHSIDTHEVFVGFYGGEPLLEFPMIEELVGFAEKELKGKKTHYTLTTNAVLLNDYMIQFFIKHKVDLVISLDGSKEAHDKNRVFATNGKGTFNAIIEKLKEISEKYPTYFKKMTINMVMDPSVDFDKMNELFIRYPFMKKVHVMSTIVDDVGALEKNKYLESFTYKERYQLFLVYLNLLNRFPRNLITPIFRNYGGTVKEDMDIVSERDCFPKQAVPSGPCVPGEVRLMVTVEGNFILCERVNEISEPMIIGNIYDGINMKKVKNLLNLAQTTKEACQNCWAFSLCNLCAKHSDKNGTLSTEERLRYCNKSKNAAISKLRNVALIREMTEVYGQTCAL